MSTRNLCFLCNDKNASAYHSFPKDPRINYLWLKVCNLTKEDDVTHIKICGNHFKNGDYSISNGYKILKSDAVPSLIFLSDKNIDEPTSPMLEIEFIEDTEDESTDTGEESEMDNEEINKENDQVVDLDQIIEEYETTEIDGETKIRTIQQFEIRIVLFLGRNNMVPLLQLKQHFLELLKFVEKDILPPSNTLCRKQLGEKALGPISNSDKQQLLSLVESIIEVPRVEGFEEVAGLWEVKKILKSLVILPKSQPQLFENRKPLNSLLLFGPPGTGKTQIVHALAYDATATLFCVTAGNIMSPLVGQTEKQIKFLFDYVRNNESFSLLFIDEVDGFCRKRTSSEQECSRRVKTELLCQINQIATNKNVFLICATNCPWELDSAFLRRFQKRICIPLPNESERSDLFRWFTKSTPLELCFSEWGNLINLTEGWSGSDIADLVKQAMNIPILELQDAKIWKICSDGFYEPVTDFVGLEMDEIHCNELDRLPPRSVRARKLQPSDMFRAFQEANVTVTKSDIQKYEEFCRK